MPDTTSPGWLVPYFDLIRKITTISKIKSRNVLITSRIGTIASSFDFGGAIAGAAMAGGLGAGGIAGTGGGVNLGAGAGAACGIAGGATAGIAGACGMAGAGGIAKAGGGGAAVAGAAAGGSAGGADIREMIRVNSPGPEFTEGAAGATGAGVCGSTGVCASR